ncbi:hypothetical protein [Brevifollis gellanilyticus]|uniref:Uncharacterized protein n=1 Tax=Brevifollis gellanilyticus TaxID=748831 RepID=A0A512MH16_9BACT|nr:hypothetical protein [Brevifollis gellanilyticus]GEP46028.1 hypothetical protein BGE01nite_53190 [Brevifollis gellanilyticus]
MDFDFDGFNAELGPVDSTSEAPTVDLDFPSEEYQELDDDQERLGFIYQLLDEESERLEGVLYGLEKRGTYVMNSLELDESSLTFSAANVGDFYVRFKEYVDHSCRDFRFNTDHDNHLTFEVFSEQGILRISGIAPQERSTRDEF